MNSSKRKTHCSDCQKQKSFSASTKHNHSSSRNISLSGSQNRKPINNSSAWKIVFAGFCCCCLCLFKSGVDVGAGGVSVFAASTPPSKVLSLDSKQSKLPLDIENENGIFGLFKVRSDKQKNSGAQQRLNKGDDGHNHGEDDGHNHGEDDGHNHGEDDGHNHGEDDGHNHDEDDGHNHKHGQAKITWLQLILSLLGVCVLSLLGAFIPKNFVQNHNLKFIAASIGAIFGTLFFELLPHTFMTAHSLASLYNGSKQNEETTEKKINQKFLLLSTSVFVGIFFGFFIETLLHAGSGGHSHGHRGCGEDCEERDENNNDPNAYKLGNTGDGFLGGENQTPLNLNDSEKVKTSEAVPQSTIEKNYTSKSLKPHKPSIQKSFNFIPTMVWVDIFAKSLHMLSDGALIGAFFVDSLKDGLVVATSVAAHEVSASLGSYALYISRGVPKRTTLLLLSIASFFVVIGGLIAGAFHKQLEKFVYIPPLATGLFLYLSLADLVPLLMHSEHRTHGGFDDEIANEHSLKRSPSIAENIEEGKFRQRLKNFLLGPFLLFVCFGLGFGSTAIILSFQGHSHNH